VTLVDHELVRVFDDSSGDDSPVFAEHAERELGFTEA